jgi:NAD(P)H-dependent FMN reductase
VPVLHILIASTRPGRVGPAIANWVHQRAQSHGHFDIELIDLADVGLPLLDEPHHPKLGNYVHEATQRWSETVNRADAFVFVMPEYNHSFNAALKNALDHLFSEWRDKPVAFVSYGGISGGLRAVAALKPVVAALRMVPVLEGVALPFAQALINDGTFAANSNHDLGAQVMLDELARMASILNPSRPSGSATPK